MEEALALIEQIIQEHRLLIYQGFQNLEGMANDASVLKGIDESKEHFMPGRFDQRQGLIKFAEALESIDKGLRAHFNREETALLVAFEKQGGKELVSALRALLRDHEDLGNRLAHSKRHVIELTSGDLARHRWEASAHDMRAHLSHTRKVLGEHAEKEQKLLHELRSRLQAETRNS